MRYRSLTLDEHCNNCTPAELRNEGAPVPATESCEWAGTV